MDTRQFNRKKSSITVSIILMILGILSILLSTPFSKSGSSVAFDSSTQIEEISKAISLSTNDLADAVAKLSTIASTLKRASDNSSNGLFLAFAAALLCTVGTILQLVTRKNFGALVEDFLSLVEKHRQLLSVKKLLEVERDNALKTIGSLEAELQNSQELLEKLENEISQLRKR